MKHQEIILVVLGYVIGFTAAFILFATSGSDSQSVQTPVASNDGYGLVAKASHDTKQQAAIIDAFVNNEGLFAQIGETERIVSATAIPPAEGIAGYHYAVPVMSISPDQHYLHYCVLTASDDTECDHYIYSVLTDSIYPVKDVVSNEYLKTDVDGLEAEWTEDNRLSINGRVSQSSDAPWMVE